MSPMVIVLLVVAVFCGGATALIAQTGLGERMPLPPRLAAARSRRRTAPASREPLEEGTDGEPGDHH